MARQISQSVFGRPFQRSPASFCREMQCEPDGGRRSVSPSNPMAPVGRNVNIAAGHKRMRLGVTFEK